jgi:phage-related protein
VYLNFTSGTAVSGSYTVVTAAANTFTVTTTASSSTSGNVTATQWYDSDNVPVYVSTSDTCAKRLNSCQTRFGANNELPFGSYPGIGTYFT